MAKNKSQQVFEALRDRILFNDVKPGEMIADQAVAKEFDVSRTPVRQALQRLASLGLVDIRDGVGSFATPIDLAEMECAYQIRCSMERLALESSIYRIKDEELDELEEKFSRFERLLEAQEAVDPRDMALVDWELHDLIIEKSDNILIAPTVERITHILRRYQIKRSAGLLRATREHIALVRCLRSKDIPGAQRILDEHLRVRTGR